MSKQTAVEWLVEHLNLDETSPNYNNLTIKKAKEMEKENLYSEQDMIEYAEFCLNEYEKNLNNKNK